MRWTRCADNERRRRVRRRRVVPTSRCWRQCTWRQSLSGRNGGKRAVLRGEYAISRKAIAQGMSDVLRCPVCSCAHILVHIAHETAGAARIRHSLRPLFDEGGKLLAKLGQSVPREYETVSAVIVCNKRGAFVHESEAKQSISPRKGKNGLLRRFAPRNDGLGCLTIESETSHGLATP